VSYLACVSRRKAARYDIYGRRIATLGDSIAPTMVCPIAFEEMPVSIRQIPRRLNPLGLLGAFIMLVPGCDPAASENAFDALRDGSLADGGAIEGRYELRVATLLDGGMRTSHHVRTEDGVYELVMADPAEPIEYDSWVRVPGQALEQSPTGARWEADELQVVAPPPQPLIDAEPRLPRRIGTVLVFWDGQGLPNGEANNSMYLDDESTNVYYGENSYGIETMAGKVFGPYQIEQPGGCNVDFIVAQGEAAMIEKGHDPSQFRQMMFYFPGGSATTTAWATRTRTRAR
jgi:hypothetical protein